MRGLFSLLLLVIPLGGNAAGSGSGSGVVSETQRLALGTLATARLQITYSQKMTMEYLQVAEGIEVATNKASLADTIKKFSDRMSYLKNGKDSYDVMNPPNTIIENTLDELESYWNEFRPVLENNIDASTLKDEDVLLDISELNEKIMKKAGVLVEEYTGYAAANQVTLPTAAVVVAGQQRVSLKKMAKEALFIGLGINVTMYIEKLQEEIAAFEVAHNGLVRGVDLMDLPALTEVCKLNTMMHVTEYWIHLEHDLQDIIDHGFTTKEELEVISKDVVLTDKEMEKAVTKFSYPAGYALTCDYISTEPGNREWKTGIAKLGYQKTLGVRSARLYLQLALGASQANGKNDLSNTLAESQSNLRMLIEGSPSQHTPSPPSQAIADDLLHAWNDYAKLQELALSSLESNQFTPLDIQKAEAYSTDQLNYVTYAGKSYMKVDEVKNTPAVRGEIIRVAYTLLMNVEKVLKEALMVALGQNAEYNKEKTKKTKKEFWDTHSLLLNGNESYSIPRTTDACTLQKMMEVKGQFNSVYALVESVVSGDLSKNQVVSTIDNIDSLCKTLSATVQQAIDYYMVGSATCETDLSTGVWEEGVTQVVKTPSYFQEAQMNFFLEASGLAAIWAEQSNKALLDHRGYIMNDAMEPTLADALGGFKIAWNDYAGNDEERMEGLQTQYIKDNPHPAGAKDALMFSPGPEYYHVVHKQYHPIYRTRLYDRDYYDIFFFDLTGNCIYTVYKELDFATNFAKDGDGEWKDSGLGDAYRMAKENPDIINVVDWLPYGPSAGALAQFLATGVKNSAGQLIGVLSTQMPPSAKPINAEELLGKALTKIDNKLEHLKFGKAEDDIPPPPSQGFANQLFKVSDKWQTVKALLQGEFGSEETQDAILAQDAAFDAEAQKLINVFLDLAFKNAKSVQGKKVAVANRQKMLINRMIKECTLISMNQHTASTKRLQDTMEEFVENHHLLVHGNLANLTLERAEGGRRMAAHQLTYMDEVPPTTEAAAVTILGHVQAAYSDLKEKMDDIIAGGDSGEVAIRAIINDGDAVSGAADSAYSYFSTVTRSTTTISVDILSPLPMTGEWTAGGTMRIAALVAQSIINDVQDLLPGYSIATTFRDDKCMSEASVQIVLEEQASSDNYIALAGSGCSTVCAGTAFVASSMRLPYLSYNCPDSSLSDVSTYPDFTRMGTVTTPMIQAVNEMGSRFSWDHITIISGDPSRYRPKAEAFAKDLAELGFSTEYVFSYDSDWDQIRAMMDLLRINKRRVYFVIGTETYFRRVICASLVVKANTGITWMSEGTWRHEWYKESDSMIVTHRQWIRQDVLQQALIDAYKSFKEGWDAFAPTDAERLTGLQKAYIEDNENPLGSKDILDYAPGPEAYHLSHKMYHPIYRSILYDRNYYDIFMLDLDGNCIYTVYKELDYATNLAIGEWKDSGLGDAYRGALAAPDAVTEIPWLPYGPSFGALASFLSTGIRDEEGELIGVFSTQFHPDEKSIDTVEEDCSLEAITAAYEGAINFAGKGLSDDVDAPLPCFPGYSAATLGSVIDAHFVDGYPTGNGENKVESVFHDVKMFTADGVCVIARAVKYLLEEEGHSIGEIRRPDESLYRKFFGYMKTTVDFTGASGRVKFNGNDLPGMLALQQVIGGKVELRGTITQNSSTDLSVNGGPTNESWQPAFPDPPPPPDSFPYLAFQILIPALCICCPAIAGCVRSA